MQAPDTLGGRTAGARRPPEPAYGLTLLVATTAFLVGAGKVAQWANRWYVAERFSESAAAGTPDAVPYPAIVAQLSSGNHALLHGLALFAVAAAFLAVALRLRRLATRIEN